MFPKAFSMMSRVTRSMSCSRTKSGRASSWIVILCPLDQDVAVAVDRTLISGLDDRRGIDLDHNGGSRDVVARAELVSRVDRGLHPLAVEVHVVAAIYC